MNASSPEMDQVATDPERVPLCVDLDGTLSRADTLHESVLSLLKKSPLTILRFPLWLIRGKAYFKKQVADLVALPVEDLPYNEQFLRWLRQEHTKGRHLVLATAADASWANAVASHIGLFSEVVATSEGENLAGEAKRDALVRKFGARGFDYAGNDFHDLPVWRSARHAILVCAPKTLCRRARSECSVTDVFESDRHAWRNWSKALRLHQWVKNLLVFVPMLLAHQVSDPQMFLRVLTGFFAFCLCASSVYILNDLADIRADRQHVRKKMRPFALAAISIPDGIVACAALLVSSFVLAASVNLQFVAALATYYTVTLIYSFLLKRVSLIDVMALSGLYTLRILAGAAAASVAPSFWLLAFSVFVFLSLALAKRYAELEMQARQGKRSAAGRAYEATDLPVLLSMGTASGYCAVLVLALYINSDQSDALYSRPEMLWLICPLLLYWISRVWTLAHRGMMHDDPIVFALKDKISIFVTACIVMSAIGAL